MTPEAQLIIDRLPAGDFVSVEDLRSQTGDFHVFALGILAGQTPDVQISKADDGYYRVPMDLVQQFVARAVQAHDQCAMCHGTAAILNPFATGEPCHCAPASATSSGGTWWNAAFLR